jgi:hypothetical protein
MFDPEPMSHLLQFAWTGDLTEGAVVPAAREQQIDDCPARLDQHLCFCVDDHARADWSSAGHDRSARARNLNGTDAANTRLPKLGMETETGDIDSVGEGYLQNGLVIPGLDRLPVERYRGHRFKPSEGSYPLSVECCRFFWSPDTSGSNGLTPSTTLSDGSTASRLEAIRPCRMTRPRQGNHAPAKEGAIETILTVGVYSSERLECNAMIGVGAGRCQPLSVFLRQKPAISRSRIPSPHSGAIALDRIAGREIEWPTFRFLYPAENTMLLNRKRISVGLQVKCALLSFAVYYCKNTSRPVVSEASDFHRKMREIRI